MKMALCIVAALARISGDRDSIEQTRATSWEDGEIPRRIYFEHLSGDRIASV